MEQARFAGFCCRPHQQRPVQPSLLPQGQRPAADMAVATAARASDQRADIARRYSRLGLIVIKLDICRFWRRLAGQDKAFFEFPGLQRVVQCHVDLAPGEQATAG